jgi:hypothetical protein
MKYPNNLLHENKINVGYTGQKCYYFFDVNMI